ncbi:MAG: HU family DNA-binding protein [Gammaproteobacteria bacterium]|uniref:HU family DNA-binding protein n=1 Tax=Pseudomaricurvus alcaniphilus TaxID=1166482 RepID=UPI0014077610|nr:HU family DNA-binding protein [Pseudomaricurvus alcaniphilus]MBR9909911.1 HU family DNA-binding protein [Gammaproteobacteria bacterium]NHN38871.1 HU family DNA-binding protein [Pseudomaricurvus alcaniphilus]
MRKNDLVTLVAERTDLDKNSAGAAVDAILEEITNALSREDTVSLPGFGAFSRRQRAARSGRNPQTGASIEIAASNSVGFKAGKALKEAVN